MIEILTFHWADDYGAILQAYALKCYLEKVSKEKVEILPYAAVKLTGRYWLYPFVGMETNGKIRYTFKFWGFKRNVSYLRKFLGRKKRVHDFRYSYLIRKKL